MRHWLQDRVGPLRSRGLWVEIGPALAFLILIWLKASYFNFPPRQHVDTDWVGWRLREAVQAAGSTLALVLLLVTPTLALGRLPRYAALWALSLLISLVVLANAVHYRFYGDVISVVSLSSAGQIGAVSDSVRALLRPFDALLFADLLAAALLFPLYRARVRTTPALPRTARRRLVTRSAVAALALLLVGPVRVVAMDRGDTFRYGYFRFFGVRRIGIVNYHLYEAGRQTMDRLARLRIGEEERARVLDYLDRWRDTASAPSPLFGAARGRNLIVIVVESLQRFPLDTRIGGEPVAPNLAAFAERSLVFRHFYGQTWEGTSADGEFTALQSLHPLAAGAVQTRFPTNYFRGLPRVLAENGYATFSSHGYYGDLWRSRTLHPRFGFQRSLFLEDFRPGDITTGALLDGEFLDEVMPEVERLPRPFMALLMTMSTHHPYQIPAEHRRLRLGELEGTLLGDYLHSVHYFDGVLGELLDRLEANGLMEESVVVIYGDHRAELGDPADLVALLTREHGYSPPEPGLDGRYWRVQNEVPLIVHLPGDAAAGTREHSGGQLDIAPTLLGLLGIRDHRMVMLGRDLTQGVNSFVVLRSGGFVLADTVCLPPQAGVAQTRCLDMSTGRRLDEGRFAGHLARARERLEISDLVIHGDLIPRPRPPPGAGARRARPRPPLTSPR